MPARIRRSRRPRRRVAHRRKRRGPRTVIANPTRYSNSFPQQMSMKLKYFSQHTFGPMTAFTVGQNIFRANGLFDIDKTLAGHQSRGFDQAMQIWNYYRVLGTKIDVTLVQSTSVEPLLMCMLFTTAAINPIASLTDLKEYQSNPGSKGLLKYRHIQNVAGVSNSGSGSGAKMSLYVPTWKGARTTSKIVNESEDWRGIQGGDPVNKVFCYVMVMPATEAAISSTYAVLDVEVTSYTRFEHRNNLGPS